MTNRKFMIFFLSGACGVFGQSSTQPTFPSARDACQSLFQAVESNDVQAITKILGGPSELASSGDENRDKAERKLFVEKHQQMHRIGPDVNGTLSLYIGAENWPFPVPLVQKDGAWRFDPDPGAQEVLYRRLGNNEFTAIEICHQFVAAKKQNSAAKQQQISSPASELVKATGDSQPILFQGYYFRALSGSHPNGYVLLAYPAAYRSSGVMTFVVTEKNVVYEKDLGADSSAAASKMGSFEKDSSWNNAESVK